MIETLFVSKTHSTMADALLACGVAVVTNDVLRLIMDDDAVSVQICDQGPYYTITLRPGLDPTQFDEITTYMPESPIIRTLKNIDELPEDLPPHVIVDYEAERDKRNAFFEARDSLSNEAKSALRRGLDHPELGILHGKTPHEHWNVFRAINPSALRGYNKLMTQWWEIQESLPEVLTLLFSVFTARPNDIAVAIKVWRKLKKERDWKVSAKTSALQIYNPAQGKGQNRTKADKLSMGNIGNAFWLVEWLKAVGFYHAALTKQLRGSKDRKTYVLMPAEITLSESDNVMHAFKQSMARTETAIKSDVLVALRYTQALLRHSQAESAQDFASLLYEKAQPSRVVTGFYNAFYKNLGNSAATMNLAFIGLPRWIHVRNAQGVKDALAVLREHEQVVRQFDESHSDDVNLLLDYRDFISGNDLRPFFEFTTAYSGYIISQRERSGGRARQFTTDNLRRLIVNTEPKLQRILETPGFQNIAYAIRQSTVLAQHWKQQGDRRYDVRYGLNQALGRKANYPEDFIAALSEFLHKYNAENAQVMENRQGPYRRSIQTSDIDDIVALVDEYGSQLICQLLIAYGYARTPRKDDEQTEAGDSSLRSE